MKLPRLRIVLGLALLASLFAALFAASYDITLHRMYQVDELENAYMVGVEAFGRQKEFMVSASLFLLPLTPIARKALSSAELMDAYRLVFLCIMWLNVFLIARATRIRLWSPLGAMVLLAAGTLAPLWAYGFELRHDNLILLGTLLLWCIGKPNGGVFRYGYVLLGAVAVLMQFCAFKALLYWAPMLGALLLFPHPAYRAVNTRVQLFAHCFLGAAIAFGSVYLLYRHLHLWNIYSQMFSGGTAVATSIESRNHDDASLHLLKLSPMVLAGAISLLVVAFQHLRRDGMRFFTWSSSAPEAALALGALGIFYVNPTPFRYNLVPLSALLLVAATRLFTELRTQLESRELRATLVAIFVACHLGPWAFGTQAMARASNARQRLLMSVAEQMTDRKRDRVYAASGLVLTRDSIGYPWFLHSLNIRHFYDGVYPSVRGMLASRPASVFIPSYRTDWLRPADKKFIRDRYLPIADDFWVLGRALPTGTGNYNVLQGGRYQIDQLNGSHVLIDGMPLPENRVTMLRRGVHKIASDTPGPLLVRWLGPTLPRLPWLPEANHRRLFIGYL